ncbi:gliding motility-associated C-terminal domain-containing protein [Membranicola marinus]|uniref:Gliding motility-associated C-terminal domain-containing protein n=1 Tax=Membranihabitans marinus TaxID=1227546 RepID=A0A953HMI0_9BACT|nr:gliding motility-associated C-terminal domain-containing protein [Membranihabitans marinus]MBY5957814.1 gliding motility-associated C-terminal domain-containing protein [Membranihabitans marinus]
MRLFSLLIFTWFCATHSLSAQAPLEISMPDTTTARGAQICIPLTVNQFNNVGTFSFVMRWNPGVIDFDTLNFKNPVLSTGGSNLAMNKDLSNEGVLVFSWFANNLAPIQIPDDSTFLEVCFEAIGQIGDSTNLTVGSYKETDISFTDTSSLSDPNINFTISDGSITVVPTGNLDFNYSACESGSGFEMNVEVFSGTEPYSYTLTGAATGDASGLSTPFDITGLSAGDYTLVITDADGQSVSKDITLQNNNVNPQVSGVPNTCSTSNPNGMVYLAAPLPGNHQIQWTYDNENYYNVDTLKNLSGGEVRLFITDENNCEQAAGTYTVEDLGLQATATVLTPPSCSGAPGSVQIDILGGTPPYDIYNGGNSVNVSSSSITLDLYSTSETFNIRDGSGGSCAENLTVTSTPVGGDQFTLSEETINNIDCENLDTPGLQYRGTVTNSSGSGNPFARADLFFADDTPVNGIYYIANASTGLLRAFDLDAGEYYWAIEGECTDTTFRFTIEDLTTTPPSVDATITPIGCGTGSELGAISLTVFPTGNGYTYEWSTGDSTAAVTDLDTGRYTVTVTDTLSKCSLTETYNIQAGVIFTKTEGTLPCDADTMINVGVTIRSDYQSILWDSGENTEIITVSQPGYYPFTITPEDPACTPLRDSIYVASEAGGVMVLGLNPVLIDNCFNPEAIMVAHTNPHPDSLGFSWDNGPITVGLNDMRFFGDEEHNLKIFKGECVAIDTNFRFEFNNVIIIDSTIQNIDCHGNENGEIYVSARKVGGGNFGFLYEFNNSGQDEPLIAKRNLQPGSYSVRIKDQSPVTANKCPDYNKSFTITEPEPFTVTVDSSQVTLPSCYGDSDGSLLLVSTGGNPGTKEIRYNFSGGAKRTNDLFLDSLKASNYQIRVEDSLGCVANTTYMLEQPEPVNFTIPPIEEPECAGYTTTVTISNATGGTGMDYQYSVDGGVPVPLGDPLDILAGTHDITVFDGNLCNVTNAVTIREPAPIIVDFNQPDTLQVSLGENTDISAQITADNPIDDYIWTPVSADSLSSDNTLTFTAVDNVVIGLEVIDSRGCVGSNEIFVLVRKRRDVGIPNAFSPNGDGHNDLLTIIPGPSVRSIKKFQIYDRWGNLMWEESDISPAQAQITGWDGTSAGQPVTFDVYVALVKVEYIDGQVIQRITDVTLIK